MASRALLGVATCLAVSEGALPPASDGDYLGPDSAADAGASPGAFDRDHSNPTAVDAPASHGALNRDRVSRPKAAATWWPAASEGITGSVRDDLIQANQALAENERIRAANYAYSAERGKLLSRSEALVGRTRTLTEENARLRGEVESLKKEQRSMRRSLSEQQKAEQELRSSIQGLQDEKAALRLKNGEQRSLVRASQKELQGERSQSASLTEQMKGKDEELTAQVEELQGQMARMAAEAEQKEKDLEQRDEALRAQAAKERETIREVWKENTKLRDSNDVLLQNNMKLRKMVGQIKGMADDLSQAD